MAENRFAELVEMLGESTAHKLSTQLGGQEVHLSFASGATSRIVQAVGQDAARRLAEYYGNSKLVIPMGPATRKARGMELARGGATDAQIAKKLGVHMKTAQRYRRAVRDERQQELPFD